MISLIEFDQPRIGNARGKSMRIGWRNQYFIRNRGFSGMRRINANYWLLLEGQPQSSMPDVQPFPVYRLRMSAIPFEKRERLWVVSKAFLPSTNDRATTRQN